MRKGSGTLKRHGMGLASSPVYLLRSGVSDRGSLTLERTYWSILSLTSPLSRVTVDDRGYILQDR